MHAKRRDRFEVEVGEVNISPLIDMVFILLIFFIVTTVFVEEEGLEGTTGDVAPPREDVRAPEVLLTGSGRVYLDEREVTLGALEQELRLRRGDGDATVTLVMEPTVLVTASVSVMDQCSRAGFTRIVLKALAE